MSESAFISSFIGSLLLVYFVGYQWGKYAKIIKELGRVV